MAENLPTWVEVGAKALLQFGRHSTTYEQMTVTKITPTQQVVLSGNSRGERRFKLRDFQADGTAHRWISDGRAMGYSLDLYPMDHPKVPKMIARQEEARTRRNVQVGIDNWSKEPSPAASQALRLRLEVWEQAVQMVEDV